MTLLKPRIPWSHYAIALLGILAVAGGLSLIASDKPDGLERSLEILSPGQSQEQEALPQSAPMADYQAPGVESPWLRTSLAGILGALATLGGVMALFYFLIRTRRT